MTMPIRAIAAAGFRSTAAAAATTSATVRSQRRFASLRSRLQSEELAKSDGNPEQLTFAQMAEKHPDGGVPRQASFEELENFNTVVASDREKAQAEARLQQTGYEGVDRRAAQVEEVVNEMTEAELEENKEIIKKMLVRGARAVGVCLVGMSIAVYVYRGKKQEAQLQREASADPEVNVADTLRDFSKAFSEAVVEESPEEAEATAKKKADEPKSLLSSVAALFSGEQK